MNEIAHNAIVQHISSAPRVFLHSTITIGVTEPGSEIIMSLQEDKSDEHLGMYLGYSKNVEGQVLIHLDNYMHGPFTIVAIRTTETEATVVQ